MSEIRFAAIADDYTGGSDLAGMLHAGQIATIQLFGVPERPLDEIVPEETDAVVVSLKVRSIDAREATRVALAALDRLNALKPRQLQYKYCSTFDSTPRGNIGPVTEALLTALGEDLTIAVPALPINGRTQYLGHLFVNGRLLSESPLRHHPLNPMDDADLVRWLQRQTSLKVGLVPLGAVLPEEIDRLRASGVRIALVDAVSDGDLAVISYAVQSMKFITGGSGLATPLAAIWRNDGSARTGGTTARLASSAGGTLILAGSCSAATLEQLRIWKESGQRVIQCAEPDEILRALPEVRGELARNGIATVASSAPPDGRSTSPHASEAFESAFGELAKSIVEEGLAQSLIVAGGETSGAVVDALDVKAAQVMSIVTPGVPSLVTLDARRLWLVLKSGNFGGPNFFSHTIEHRRSLCSQTLRT